MPADSASSRRWMTSIPRSCGFCGTATSASTGVPVPWNARRSSTSNAWPTSTSASTAGVGAEIVGVALVVNTYERTYRSVLAPGFFPQVVDSNQRQFDEVVALVNNVDDERDARSRAEALISRGEITSYALVADHIQAALERTGLTGRSLRRHPYLLDYGLVMPHVCTSEWLVGWDAETELETAANWVDPGIELLERYPRLFHTSLAWPAHRADWPGLEGEEIGRIGD